MNKPKILIVDDESFNVELVTELLENDFDIYGITESKEVLQMVLSLKPDLILLDISMPHLNGYDIANLLQKDTITKDIPIIFVTGNGDQVSIIKGFEVGAVDYVKKPFTKEELIARVKTHVNIYLLQQKLKDQQKFIQSIINTQPNLVIISDGKKALYANRQLLKFYHCRDLKEFNSMYECICTSFLKNEKYFHLDKIKENQNWIEELQKYPPEERLVSIVSQDDFTVKVFHVSIETYEKKSYIINLNDISQTILKQIKLEDKTIHDTLTYAYNREYFEQNYQKIIEHFTQDQKQFALAFIDIDFFKKVNDTYGHNVGDSVLVELVNLIKRYSRKDDKIIRWGGEEFIFILQVVQKEDLLKALEHLRTVIEKHTFQDIGKLTCSFGTTIYNKNEDIETTIKRADMALYTAKNNGRNRIIYS